MPCTEENLCGILRIYKGRICLNLPPVLVEGEESTRYVLVENRIKGKQIFLSGLSKMILPKADFVISR